MAAVPALALATILASVPASAGSYSLRSVQSAALVIPDRLGDGQPDIVQLRVEASRLAMVLVTVRVRGVTKDNTELRLYVDPSGARRRPTYVMTLPIWTASEYGVMRTSGWRLLTRQRFTCGERIRLFAPTARVRVIRFRMPGACFGDRGARFAAQTPRLSLDGTPMPGSDWTPRHRTLSRTFLF
jgi:hypothetical protein